VPAVQASAGAHRVLAISVDASMDSPKSEILICSELVRRMFSGLMSLCTMPCSSRGHTAQAETISDPAHGVHDLARSGTIWHDLGCYGVL
jgi:hypothetical protein